MVGPSGMGIDSNIDAANVLEATYFDAYTADSVTVPAVGEDVTITSVVNGEAWDIDSWWFGAHVNDAGSYNFEGKLKSISGTTAVITCARSTGAGAGVSGWSFTRSAPPIQRLPLMAVSGLTVTISKSDNQHDFVVSKGVIRDSTDTVDLVLNSSLTKQIDVAFAEGDNAGCMLTSATKTGTISQAGTTALTGSGTLFLTDLGNSGAQGSYSADFSSQCSSIIKCASYASYYSMAGFPTIITIDGGTYIDSAGATTNTSGDAGTARTYSNKTYAIGGYNSTISAFYYICIGRKDSTGACELFVTPGTGNGILNTPTGYTFHRVLALLSVDTGKISSLLQPLRGGGDNHSLVFGARLSASTVSAVPTNSSSSGSYVFLVPFGQSPGVVPLWDGSQWFPAQFFGATNQLNNSTYNPAAVVALGLYNLYLWDDPTYSTALRLSRGARLPPTTATVTMTIASPCVVTYTAHGLTPGTPIVFTTTGALPTSVTAGTVYYVIATGLAANTFRFSATLNGTAVNSSGTQSGTHTCTVGWTGSPASEITLGAYGVYTNTNDITNGPKAGFGLYVGTIAINEAAGLDWQWPSAAATPVEGRFHIWNYFNRVDIRGMTGDTVNTWNATAAFRPWNNKYTNRITFVTGIAGEYLRASTIMPVSGGGSANSTYVGIGYDQSNGCDSVSPVIPAGVFGLSVSTLVNQPAAGFHYLYPVAINADSLATLYGDNGQTFTVSGMEFSLFM